MLPQTPMGELFSPNRAFTRFIGLQFDTSSSPELKVHKGHSRLGTRHSQSLSALDQHQGFGAVDRVVTERAGGPGKEAAQRQGKWKRPMERFLDVHVARPRQAIGQAERRDLREASPRGSVGGGRASSRKWNVVSHQLPLLRGPRR
eukprot:1176092-Prorocentrum_minimum.AAC.7